MIVEIVILAMIAAFLGLRLYSVLGRRAEHEEEPVRTRFDRSEGGNVPRPIAQASVDLPRRNREIAEFPPAIERGLRDISNADRRFDLLTFLEGAKAAYGMVLEAFWRGDKEELRQLCDDDVYQSFASAIDAREAAEAAYRMILEAYWKGDRDTLRDLCDDDSYEAFVEAIAAREARGETLDNRLIRIEDTVVNSASLDGRTARIAVSFVADIASVVRDKDGNVVAGSLDDAIESRDVWTFSRNVDSADPDWLLDETDEG